MIEPLMAARQTAPNSGLSPVEQENASRFFAAAVRLYGSQVALAKATGIDQLTISGAIGLRYGIGHKVLAAAARATGTPIEAITSGAGAIELEARANPLFDAEAPLILYSQVRATAKFSQLHQLLSVRPAISAKAPRITTARPIIGRPLLSPCT